jgi:micrococcal nuclease
VFGKTVKLVEKKKDRWGRTVGHVIVDGKDTNLAMLDAGMAWHYRQYSKNKRLQQAEDEARSAKRGLWADRDPVPPWEWRKTGRERRAAMQAK